MIQHSADPTSTGHLHAGPRITLDELSVQLSAAAVWLRQLAVAAETPEVPVELREISQDLDGIAARLTERAETVAKVDNIVTERLPLAPDFDGRDPWGSAAVDAERADGRPAPIVLTHWQILHLAQWQEARKAIADLPARPQRQRTAPPWPAGGIAYLDGIAGVPGIETWESTRAAERRDAERATAIREQAAQLRCPTCKVLDGPCKTRNDRIADTFHRPRIAAATALVDGSEQERQ